MKLALILSNDWEIYGDGSGDFFEIQHKPTNQLLDVCERHGAKLTLMAEVGQQWAYENPSNDPPQKTEIAEAWRLQLQDALRRGHDAQLHLHPQWLTAQYNNNKWHLNFSQWSLNSIAPATQQETLIKGKQYLESLLQPIRPDYRCLGFRAGGFCIQPSREPIKALRHAGFLADSSVKKGDFIKSEIASYDFRHAHSDVVPWVIDANDINKESFSGDDSMIEFPVYCESRWAVLKKFEDLFFVPTQERRRQFKRLEMDRRHYPQGPSLLQETRSPKTIWNKITGKTPTALDYVSLPPTRAVRMLKRLYQRYINTEGTLPVMAIAHAKNMWFPDDVNDFLELAKKSLGPDLLFWTFQEAIENRINHKD